ncbi:MAG: hypothetical protein LBI06_08635 [Treponema sp.]|nr:hypothetical protein [Treponema sp.]
MKIILICIFTYCLLVFGCSKSVTNNFDDYNKRRSNSMYHSYIAQQIMPNLDDLPEYEKIYYQYRNIIRIPFIFNSETMLLVVTYNNITYQIEKEKINNLNYLEKAKYKTYEKEISYLLPEFEFQINSYNFRVLAESKDNDFDYPHYIGIIATSNEKRSISYLYFADQDLDYISKDNNEGEMIKFVKEYFKYEW